MLFCMRYLTIMISTGLVAGMLFAGHGTMAAFEAPSVSDNLTNTGTAGGYAEVEGSPFEAFARAIGGIIGVFFAFIGVLFLGFMVYAGWLWLTAGGNEEQVSKAKNLIRQAVIGLVIAVAAYGITYFVLQQLAPFNERLQGFQ